MQKFFISLTLACILLSLPCFAQNEKVIEVYGHNFHGNIKSITRTEYKYIDDYGELQKKIERMTFYIYDEKENLIREADFDEYFQPTFRHDYSYDDKGNLLIDDKYYKGDLSAKSVYTYDDQGHKLTFIMYDGYYEFPRKEIYTYDDKGNLLSMTEYDWDGKISNQETNSYDANGILRYKTIRFISSFSDDTTEELFDAKGNIVLSNRYNEDGKLTGKTKFSYDGKGHLLTESRFDENGAIGVIEYTYDDNGNRTSANYYYAGGESGGKEIYTYDDKGNLLSRAVYDELGELYFQERSTYDENGNELTYVKEKAGKKTRDVIDTYDDKGNLLTETYFSDGVPFRSEEYDVEYY